MPNLREDQAYISVRVGGVNALDASDVAYTALNTAVPSTGWTGLSGGDLQADDVKTRPGKMSPEISLGGPQTRGDATVTIQYSTALDAILQTLETQGGKRSMAVSWNVLDADGNANGPTNTITGVLKNVTRPNFDANNTAATFLTLTMSCHV